MKTVLITGSLGLVGSSCVDFFSKKFDLVLGIDNDMRAYFYGKEHSTFNDDHPFFSLENYTHFNVDVRSKQMEQIFKDYNKDIDLIIHTAAQPSHDWAVKEPLTDYAINSSATVSILENFRLHCPSSKFIFVSTNKVYGDTPNKLPLVELEKRWEIERNHPFYENGINETMSIDQCLHSLFGASKLSSDIYVQEYGKYFNLHTSVFRCGCITGKNHKGAKLHGFLSYLSACFKKGETYTIFGYKGKQVRDNIHANDLTSMFWHYYLTPKKGVVYNAGGGRELSCSVIEVIEKLEILTKKKMDYTYLDQARIGDHIWYISDNSKFQHDYPDWKMTYTFNDLLNDLLSN